MNFNFSIIKRIIIAYIFTFFFSILYFILSTVLALVKCPFKNPFAVNSAIQPPSRLTDPKYGTHKYIRANNVKLHYVESGDPNKPLMLFLHGFPEFWYSWRHQILHFNSKYRCVAVDMRGYGDSEKPEGVEAYKIEILVEDVYDLIHQLGVEKCTLVSHDWGGIVACKFRDTYPEAVDALVMLASTSLEAWFYQIWNTFEQRMKSTYVFMFRAPVIPEMILRMGDISVFKNIMYVKGKNGVEEQDIECFRYCYRSKSAFTSPLNYYRANFTYNTLQQYHEEKVPFLIAQVANDSALSHNLLDIIKRDYAHVETAFFETCQHFVQQEEPEKVNKVIEDFLFRHSRSTVD